MDGRQYFPGYGGPYQPVPDFNATGYGRGYGVPGSYFMAGPSAGMAAAIIHVLRLGERPLAVFAEQSFVQLDRSS